MQFFKRQLVVALMLSPGYFSFELSATPIKWTLSDVRLADGSSVSGYFIYDADSPPPETGLTNFEIAIDGGSVMPTEVYTPSNMLTQLLIYSYPGQSGTQIEVLNAFGRNQTGGEPALELLYLDPSTFFSDAGGVVGLNLALSTGQLSNGEVSYDFVAVTGGEFIGVPASAIPEPPFCVFTAVGIGASAFMSLRRGSGQRSKTRILRRR